MDKKSKTFIAIFFLLIIISAATIYYRYIVLKDFTVTETVTENE
jgi:hypothetical protein